MDEAIYIGVTFIAYLVLWIGYATLYPIEGIWRRDGEDEEYIHIEQFGPFVTGKRNVEGGNHIYMGLQTFNRVRLRRRDWGLPALIQAGFPSTIAKKLNGSIMAKLSVKRRGRKVLEGYFRPQKVLFDESAAQVLSRQYQPPIYRSFSLTDLNELPNTKGATMRHSGLPPPDKVTKKKRNTF